jgi:hypothetical protein
MPFPPSKFLIAIASRFVVFISDSILIAQKRPDFVAFAAAGDIHGGVYLRELSGTDLRVGVDFETAGGEEVVSF